MHLRSDWESAWELARQWSQAPDDSTRAGQTDIHPLTSWQLFVHRGGSWANALSSDAMTLNGQNNTTAVPGNTPPDGVRLVLNLPNGATGTGLLTLDWVRPTFSAATP
jgi:general secretion pathway protein J